MQQGPHSIFNSWIPQKFVVPILILTAFPHLMLLSIFNMNSTFSASFLDLEVDDLQFLFCMAYGTIVCSLFFHTRIYGFFNIRSYLLVTTMLNILILLGMTMTANPQLILLLRFAQGPLMFLEGVILLPIIMSNIKSPHAKIIGFSFLYSYMLTGDKITLTLVKFAIENYSHNVMLYTIIAFHVLTLFIFIFLFNENRMFPKKPMYQMNLGGVCLMVICVVCGAFFFVYGKKYEWFESPLIVFSCIGMLVSAGLFLLHQKTSKRPLFHFEIFRSERIILGIILFFFFYILRGSMSNIYQVMNVVWKWEWEYVLKVQYFNVGGSLTGALVACIMMMKKIDLRIMIGIGFTLITGTMLWFSYLFYPDVTLLAIAPPLFLEGLGQGFVFAPLVFYMLGSVHADFSGSASHAGTTIRFWTTTIGYAIMQNAMFYLTTKNQNMMTKNMDISNPIFQNEWNALVNKNGLTHITNETINMSAAIMKSRLYNQALLISCMELFTALFIMGLCVVIGLISYQTIKTRFFAKKSKGLV